MLVLTCCIPFAPFLPKGNLEVVQLLVREGGAAVDEESLSLAREHSHQNVAIFLLEHIDLYAGLEDEDEIMEKACREGDVAKVRQINSPLLSSPFLF